VDQIVTSRKQFKTTHNTIAKNHKSLNLPSKILPEWGRGRWFLSNLPKPTGKVLDLCGSFGYWGAYVLKVEGYRFSYTCLDKHDICTNFGPKYFKLLDLEGEFIQHDIENPLPFLDETFNQVWLFGWWIKKFNIEHLFSEVHRVLRDRGFFLLDAATMKTVVHGRPYPLSFTEEGLIQDLEKTGFRVLRMDAYYRSRWKNERHRFMGGVCIKPPIHSMNVINNLLYHIPYS